MKNRCLIAGPNGAGKTTASFTILPDILACEEFVNADEIAKGLSPFRPETARVQAGKLMLRRIQTLLEGEAGLAFETTLSTRGFLHHIEKTKEKKFWVTLLFSGWIA